MTRAIRIAQGIHAAGLAVVALVLALVAALAALFMTVFFPRALEMIDFAARGGVHPPAKSK